VLQGGIVSPFLSNWFINELIVKLKTKCYELFVYANDLAVICYSREQLEISMEILENWFRLNQVEVNKKKVKF